MCLSLAARYRRREVERRPVSPTNNTSAASVGFKGTSRNRLSCKCCRIVSVLSGWPRGNRKDDFGPGQAAEKFRTFAIGTGRWGRHRTDRRAALSVGDQKHGSYNSEQGMGKWLDGRRGKPCEGSDHERP